MPRSRPFAACLCGTLILLSTCGAAFAAPEPPAGRTSDNTLCAEHRSEAHHGTTPEDQIQAMREEIAAYQNLAEETLSMRATAIELYHELRAKLDRSEPLSGEDLLRLNQGATLMLEQRETLLRISQEHECWLDDAIPEEAALARVQASGIALSLSAALLLYDNYLSAISLYRSDITLRRHLNRADKSFDLREGRLNEIALSFASPNNRYRARRAIQWFEDHGYGDVSTDDDGYRYLVGLIEQSPARNAVRTAHPIGFVGRLTGLLASTGLDTLLELKDQGVFVPSMVFGNAVGLIESRRGKLDGQPELVDHVSARLRAGDILLEKTPFRLTDSFIPGHWGHVAVWIGTPDELRALGIWEHPVVRKHHAEIEAGRGIVEALRSGVKMNTVPHFMNIDDLAVLRDSEMLEGQRVQVILQALRQVGKGYDFNFDVESTDRIVCSELVYHTFVHRQWPTAKALGRVTISPDNVARHAAPGDFLDVVMLYHDGNEIVDAPRTYMAELLRIAEPVASPTDAPKDDTRFDEAQRASAAPDRAHL